MYLSILILSLLTIFIITISIVVIEIKKDLKSVKEHGARQSKEQIRLTKKLLKILEKSHPDIFEEINDEIVNDNIIDIAKCKRSS